MDDRGFDALSRRIATVTSRRSAFAVLSGGLGMLGALLKRDAIAQRRPNLCRPLGGACFPSRDVGCCGNVTCRQGKCRCGRKQRACGGRCISRRRCCHNRDCGRGQHCRKGRCRGTGRPGRPGCPGQQKKCGQRCVNLKTARAHCGACGNACAGTAVCKQGACVAGAAYREVRRWGGENHGDPLTPAGIALDQAGLVYVTDNQSTGHVWKFTASGNFIEAFPTGPLRFRPLGIDISPAGVVYVGHPSGDNTVDTYSLDGTPGFSFNTAATSNGLAVGANGDVYVALLSIMVAQRFTAGGTLIENWEPPAQGIALPYWVATAPNGDVYVTEFVAGLVHRFSATGASKGSITVPGTPPPLLAGITVDAAGFVYVIAPILGLVYKFTANGSLVGHFGDSSMFTQLQDIAVSKTGMVYVTDYHGDEPGEIVQFEPA